MNRNLVILAIIVLLALLSIRIWYFYHHSEYLVDGEELNFQTRLIDDPEIKNGRQQFSLKSDSGQRIYITTGLFPQLNYGDKILIRGELTKKNFESYSIFTMSFPNIQIIDNDHNFITSAVITIRRKTNKIYQKSLSPVSAGLLSGIVFGGDRNLPKEFADDLRISGVTHVIAASGMNVTFVASFLMGVFALFFRRQIAITIAIFGIFFYAYIAGLEPSIVRAAIMGAIVFSAKLLGKESFALLSLIITVFVMIFYNPNFLSEVGFQLSVVATAGIVLIKPILDRGFEQFGKFGKLVREDIGTTISAQIMTLPILLGTFGIFNLLSVIVNALVLWTIPILMILGGISLILGFIFEPLGQIVIFLSAPFLFYFQKIVSFFGAHSVTISIEDVSISFWLGYYLILVGLLLFIRKKYSGVETKHKNTP